MAVFIYEMSQDCYKVSLRSNNQVDVSLIAAAHGGGGHVPAAGFECAMNYDSLMELLLKEIGEQLAVL